MRYTRYNYKKNGDNYILKIIIRLVLTVAGAWVCGLIIATLVLKVLPQNNSSEIVSNNTNEADISTNADVVENTNGESSEVNSNEVSNNSLISTFISVQCGYFSSEENANQMLSNISNNYAGFIAASDDGKYRVLSGIYTETDGNMVADQLSQVGVECAKSSYSFDLTDASEEQLSSICDGYLKVLYTAFNDEVKSVNTTDFKAWINGLDDVNDGKYAEILTQVKSYINSLPDEIVKENVPTEMKYIYTLLQNFKNS